MLAHETMPTYLSVTLAGFMAAIGLVIAVLVIAIARSIWRGF